MIENVPGVIQSRAQGVTCTFVSSFPRSRHIRSQKVKFRCSKMPPILATGLRRRKTCKDYLSDALQVFHFLVAMCFLWAGLVEFIRNPPYFDAYGDAATLNDLPKGLFEVKVQ